MKSLKIYIDGASKGNPGPAGIGIVIYDKRKEIYKSKYIGEATNNEAEYQALIFALEEAKKRKAEKVDIFSDSELLINQLNRRYKIKDPNLAKLFLKVWNLSLAFKKVKFHHILREDNQMADLLANQAIERKENNS